MSEKPKTQNLESVGIAEARGKIEDAAPAMFRALTRMLIEYDDGEITAEAIGQASAAQAMAQHANTFDFLEAEAQ